MSLTIIRAAAPHPTRPRSGLARAAAVIVALFLVAHGAVHAMGMALLWKLGEPGQLRYADAVPIPGTVGGYLAGVGWLAAGALLITTAGLLLARRRAWRITALTGALLSAAVIGLNPTHAVAGLVADGLVLVLVTGSWLRSRRGGVRP